ncbi:energy-coupled thiamine transporter ThiT [Bacillaceae bacterium W0354]
MQNKRTLMLVEIAVFATLAFVLDFFTLFKMPQGGSVNLSMIPVFIVAFRWGLKAGLASGFIFGLLQLIYAGIAIDIVQAVFEYVVAFFVLGFAGLFSKQIISALNNNNRASITLWIIVATFIASMLRFLAHFTAGIVWWSHFTPEGQTVWGYSFVYNITYMLPCFLISAAFCIIVFTSRPQLIVKSA